MAVRHSHVTSIHSPFNFLLQLLFKRFITSPSSLSNPINNTTMNLIELLYVIRWVTLGLAFCAITYKFYAINGIFKSKKLILSRLLSFYSQEKIYSTSVRKKRDAMIVSNWTTAVMLACLIPNLTLVLVNLASKLLDFMDSIL